VAFITPIMYIDRGAVKMKTLSDDLLQEIVRRLVAEFDPEQIILFGSHAWGTPDEDSDVDLMVIVSESDERPAARATRAYRAMGLLAAPVEFMVKTRSEVARYQDVRPSLEWKVLRQGKSVYG
jgi:predicted nucleotidyltransferase